MSGIDPDLSKAGAQIAVDTAADGRRALTAIFGEAAEELAHIFSDSVKLWRFRNLLTIRDKVDAIVAERGLTNEQLKALPYGDSLRVADAASCEDQPELQALWARLIANAMSGERGSIERALVDLLKSLSPTEVMLLDLLWKWYCLPGQASTNEQLNEAAAALEISAAAKAWEALPDDGLQLAIQNLLRLRCVAIPAPKISPFLVNQEIFSSDLGVTTLRSLDASKVERSLNEISRYLVVANGGSAAVGPYAGGLAQSKPRWHQFTLAPLGRALMAACDEPAVKSGAG